MSVRPAFYRMLLIFFVGISVTACSAMKPPAINASCDSRVSTIYSGPSERSYCSTVAASTGITITGKAVYEARVIGATGGLTAVKTGANAINIRYAEVEILNAAGEQVNCGQTDGDGEFSLDVPSATQTYTVRVNSRSARLNSFTTPYENPVINASVLNCPEENAVYSITANVTPNVDPTVELTAKYDGDVVGGAFNIYEQFVAANLFLSDPNQAGGNSCTALNCQTFTVAPKVSAYWVKGFNPNAYFGETEDGISFYIPGYSRLFIMGGVDGDEANSDTDHWDNSVILHEYGHFLEDAYVITNSPGGSHSGGQIDPRLAWSEGWGNFFQAAVRGTACYTDTSNEESDGFIFNIPLQNTSNSVGCTGGSYNTGFDAATVDGQGVFHEFTITRYLYDLFDSDAEAGDDIDNAFGEIWAAMTSPTGFNSTSQNFRNVGLLNKIQASFGTNSWDTVKASHFMGTGNENYAPLVAPNTLGCADVTFTLPVTGGVYLPNNFYENLLERNDFYFYKHPGGTFKINMSYANVGGTGSINDVDIRMYNSSARLFRSDRKDEVLRAETTPGGGSTAAMTFTETATKTLPAGDYLIQVLSYTAGSSFTYSLAVNNVNYPTGTYPNGVELCVVP